MAVLLKDIVPSLFAQKNDWRTTLLARWDEIVGSLKTRIRLEKIYDDTLIIGVFESHWLQELHLLSQVLIDSINQLLSEPHIKHLRFKLVESKKVNIGKKMKLQPSKKSKNVQVTLSAQQTKALHALSDKQLRDALIRFWARCLEMRAFE